MTSYMPRRHLHLFGLPAVAAFGMGVGTGLYYAWQTEPQAWMGALGAAILAVLLRFVGRRGFLKHVLVFALFAAVGFGSAAWQSQQSENRVLPQAYDGKKLWMVGRIAELKTYDGGKNTAVFDTVKIYGVPPTLAPTKVRVSTSHDRFGKFQEGDWLALRAELHAPSQPAFDGAPDRRLQEWQKGVGATGFVMGRIYATVPPDDLLQKYVTAHGGTFEALRERLTARMLAGGGAEGETERGEVSAVSSSDVVGRMPVFEDGYGASAGSDEDDRAESEENGEGAGKAGDGRDGKAVADGGGGGSSGF